MQRWVVEMLHSAFSSQHSVVKSWGGAVEVNCPTLPKNWEGWAALVEVALYDFAFAEFVFGLHDYVAVVALGLTGEFGEIAFRNEDHVKADPFEIFELRESLGVGGKNQQCLWTVRLGKIFLDQFQERSWNSCLRHRSILPASRVRWR
jgi:hypothetical protein